MPPPPTTGDERSPTLEEALLDPALIDRYIAPYARVLEGKAPDNVGEDASR